MRMKRYGDPLGGHFWSPPQPGPSAPSWLTEIAYIDTYYSLYRCRCGTEKRIVRSHVRRGYVISCGCYKRKNASIRNATHGNTRGYKRSPTYAVWIGIKTRCENKNAKLYARYGALGVTVCERWSASFEAFLADMGERPDGMSIDRVDNDRGYEPGNCRWATAAEQAFNQRKTIHVTYQGGEYSLSAFARLMGINYGHLRECVAKGQDPIIAAQRVRTWGSKGYRLRAAS